MGQFDNKGAYVHKGMQQLYLRGFLRTGAFEAQGYRVCIRAVCAPREQPVHKGAVQAQDSTAQESQAIAGSSKH